MYMRSTATPTSARRSCSSAADAGGISSGRATIAAPVWSWSVIRSAPTRAIAAKVARRLQKADPMAGRRRVDDHQVELAPARPQGQERAEVRPGDRRRAGDRPRDRLPADAAHLRRDRPGRADPLPGPAAERPDHRPRAHRHRDRRPARGDAGQRDGGARARPRTEVGVAVDRIYLNGLYPERFSKRRPSSSERSPRGPTAGRAAARAALSEHGRARSQRAQLARLRRRVEAPVKTLPFLFEPELDVEAARQLARKLNDAGRRRAPRRQGHLHLRRLGRRRQDDDLGGDRGRDGRPRAARSCVLTIDPAKRLADSLGLTELGNEARAGRPGAVRRATASRCEGELWAMMLDAKRPSTSSSRASRPTSERATGSSATASTSSSPTPSPARRSTWRWRSSTSCTARAASTCSCSTRRRPATRSTSSTRRERLTQFIEGRALRVFMRPTGLAARSSGAAPSRRSRCCKRIDRRRPARRPVRVLQRLRRHGRRLPASAPSGSTSCSPTAAPRFLVVCGAAGRAGRRGGLLPPQAGRGEAAVRRRDRQQGPLPGRAAARRGDRPAGARSPRSSATRTSPSGSPTTSPTTRRWPSATPRNIERLAGGAARPAA